MIILWNHGYSKGTFAFSLWQPAITRSTTRKHNLPIEDLHVTSSMTLRAVAAILEVFFLRRTGRFLTLFPLKRPARRETNTSNMADVRRWRHRVTSLQVLNRRKKHQCVLLQLASNSIKLNLTAKSTPMIYHYLLPTIIIITKKSWNVVFEAEKYHLLYTQTLKTKCISSNNGTQFQFKQSHFPVGNVTSFESIFRLPMTSLSSPAVTSATCIVRWRSRSKHNQQVLWLWNLRFVHLFFYFRQSSRGE
jgi:hypothetical protein